MAIYLFLDGITGESTVKGFTDWMEIQSFSWGASNPVSEAGAGGQAGKVSMSDITITKTLDRGSPKLMLACCNGTHFKNATLTITKTNGEQQQKSYLTIKLTDVFISSYQTSGDAGGSPSDSVTLYFQSMDLDLDGEGTKGAFDENVRISRNALG